MWSAARRRWGGSKNGWRVAAPAIRRFGPWGQPSPFFSAGTPSTACPRRAMIQASTSASIQTGGVFGRSSNGCGKPGCWRSRHRVGTLISPSFRQRAAILNRMRGLPGRARRGLPEDLGGGDGADPCRWVSSVFGACSVIGLPPRSLPFNAGSKPRRRRGCQTEVNLKILPYYFRLCIERRACLILSPTSLTWISAASATSFATALNVLRCGFEPAILMGTPGKYFSKAMINSLKS